METERANVAPGGTYVDTAVNVTTFYSLLSILALAVCAVVVSANHTGAAEVFNPDFDF